MDRCFKDLLPCGNYRNLELLLGFGFLGSARPAHVADHSGAVISLPIPGAAAPGESASASVMRRSTVPALSPKLIA